VETRSEKVNNLWKQNYIVPDKSGPSRTSPVRIALNKSGVERTSPVLTVLRPKIGNPSQKTISSLGKIRKRLSIP
jgi:hypothetical protein